MEALRGHPVGRKFHSTLTRTVLRPLWLQTTSLSQFHRNSVKTRLAIIRFLIFPYIVGLLRETVQSGRRLLKTLRGQISAETVIQFCV
jgi:hypothetical protein